MSFVPTILDDLGLLSALKFLAEGVAAQDRTPDHGGRGLRTFTPPAAVDNALPDRPRRIHQCDETCQGDSGRCTIQHELQTLRCSVKDNGIGFDVSSLSARTGERGLGMIGIRERLNSLGGSLSLVSTFGSRNRAGDYDCPHKFIGIVRCRCTSWWPMTIPSFVKA